MKKTRKVDKREQHIKKKLTAAILMLLISSIMTVTSTYAWFTLSTAPEVTGIQTTIGGNGNLEIALANAETWGLDSAYEYEEYSALTGEKDINTSYGNLVDLSATISGTNPKNKYGFSDIVLYPAALNYDVNDNTKVNTTTFLSTPVYGTDGRITKIEPNTVAGVYDGSGFLTSGNGVRAIGATSSMSERMFAYRNAMADIKSYKSATLNDVNQAISTHGDHLANIAVEYAMNSSAGNYTRADLLGLQSMIAETQTGVTKIETAIVNVIKAAISSKKLQETFGDDKYNLVLSEINGLTYDDLDINVGTTTDDGQGVMITDITSIDISLGSEQPINITNDFILGLVEKYYYIDAKLTAAAAAAALDEQETYSWTQISPALKHLMDTGSANVKVSGQSLDVLKGDKDKAVKYIMDDYSDDGNVSVVLGEGSSVFYDIAELVGKLSSKVTTSITYSSITLNNVNIIISTTDITNPLIDTAHSGVNALGSPDLVGTATSKIDDIYAFAIDFFVRTNAGGSNLLIQMDPTQRIYDSSSNTDTMGNGTNMTFESSSMTEPEMVNLLKNVRIMFISGDKTNNGKILAEGRLDVRNTTDETSGEISTRNYALNAQGGIIADIRLWDEVTVGTPTTSTDNAVAYVEGTDYTTKTTSSTENGVTTVTEISYTFDNNEDPTTVTKTTTVTQTKMGFIEDDKAQEIMALNKGQEHKLTVLVYLDGRTVTNADVSAFATSMSGSMNLQFASSAELVPMDYSGLSESGLGGETALATPTMTYDNDTKTLTFNKVENATSYTYKINQGTVQTVTFAEGATTTTVTLDTALSENDVVTYTASAANYTDGVYTYTYTTNN